MTPHDNAIAPVGVWAARTSAPPIDAVDEKG
jgi:hypothetical protein